MPLWEFNANSHFYPHTFMAIEISKMIRRIVNKM